MESFATALVVLVVVAALWIAAVYFPLRAAVERFDSAMGHLGAFHPQLVPEDHWYLMILGVEPARQRLGLGGALLQPVLARADREGLRCYLETQKPVNVPFYQAHGFEVAAETDVPGDGPHFWLMARTPRAR